MKHCLLLAFLLLFNLSFGQFSLESEKDRYYSAGAFSFVSNPGWFYGVEGGLWWRRHALMAGIGMDPYIYDPIYSTYALNLDYNFLPNGYKDRFDLIFDVNFNYATHAYKEYVNVNGTWEYADKNKFISYVSWHGGFGFNTNLTQHIFLKPTFDLGINTTIYNDNSYPSKTRISALIKLSAGYRIGK